MIPRRVILENFLSFGPRTEIAFTDDEPIWVLGGANGTGKSAVFDAITYALFGQHRGGAKNADMLVRHGANGFSILFEFEFNGKYYRLARNLKKTARSNSPTASVEVQTPGEETWQRVPQVNSIADVKAWTEQTLGLGFDAFSASVLLRQGKADAIIDAKGAERLKILKKIIGADRFEALSESVHTAKKAFDDRYADLTTKRDLQANEGRGKISDEQLAEAAAEVGRAAEAREDAQKRVVSAKENVGRAKRWGVLDGKRKEISERIRAAKERADNAQTIRDNRAELVTLSAVVPIARTILAARSRIATAESRHTDLADRRDKLKAEADRQAQLVAQSRSKADGCRQDAEREDHGALQLRADADREQRFMTAAEAIAQLQKDLDAFLPNLDALHQAAQSRINTAGDAVAAAGKDRIEAETLHRQAKDLLKEFEKVGAGVECTRCRQVVTAEHAARERAEMAGEIGARESRLQSARQAETRARIEAEAARGEFEALDERVQKRARTARDLATQQGTLAGLGIQVTAAELRQEVEKKRGLAAEHERRAAAARAQEAEARAAATQAENSHKRAESELATLERQLHECEQKLNEDRGQIRGLRDQLPPTWQSRADDFNTAEIDRSDDRRQHLAASGVEDDFKQLQTDEALRHEWEKQRQSIQDEIESLPAEARVPVSDVEAGERAASAQAAAADESWKRSVDAELTLKQQKEEYDRLVEDLRTTERQRDLHDKLDKLLGKKGIQRELVRGAETEIVRLANDTVQKLSNGDLSLELDRSVDSDDEAFGLLVQQSEKPAPTAAEYLSGSEKFRVSVAVALAIGRYATGKTRPLESVIIDEGFGSLDRDGLEATRLELNRLSRHLRKIILVSHQEEFANEFPVVIQLSRGRDGTTADMVRR